MRNSPKYELADGWYRMHGLKEHRVYVLNDNDSITLYAALADCQPEHVVASLPAVAEHDSARYHLHKSTFDLAILTVAAKYRPSRPSLPAQLTANLNGLLYLGLRTDLYNIRYRSNPLGPDKRDVGHYGISAGLFAGISGASVTPWSTDYAIMDEYDGIAWAKGVAMILALDQFNVGLALGWDHLMDRNKHVWIYQDRPWLGVTLGLNL